MSECCEIKNPLRRDGTSQPQRFPEALAEDYVQIDERSPEDLLNFTLRLAQEFNYYNGGNTIDNNWTEFFEDDLSFLLASISQLDLDQYKDTFQTTLVAMNFELDNFPNLSLASFPLLEKLILFFTQDVELAGPPVATVPAFPYLLDNLYELLPESDYFDDENEYSFKDEVGEARNKLRSFLGSVQIAHFELDKFFLTFPDVDNSLYENLDESWAVNPLPDLDAPGYDEEFFLDGNTPRESVYLILETLSASFDTFLSLLKVLQARIPSYLEQSFVDYPYHNPQTGLFLTFVQLFANAQEHINTLGRKHLLYYYKDVLRFSEQDLVPDQAAMVFQLRKGIENHLIEKGLLMKAGKDVDGNALYYEIDRETVINQAVIEDIKTVYVERKDGDPDLEVQGIFAAPDAKSLDGQGAELDEDEPKWNTFGEAQLAKNDADQTMLEADLGFAVASPIFVMKEGKREVFLTLFLDRSIGSTFLEFGEDDDKRYKAEADILQGLKAQFTSDKGWEDATVDCVMILSEDAQLEVHGINENDVFGVESVDFSKHTILGIKLNIFEYNSPAVPFDSAIHEGVYETKWPVIKLSFDSSSNGFASLEIGSVLDLGASHADESLWLFEGNVYQYTQASTSGSGGNSGSSGGSSSNHSGRNVGGEVIKIGQDREGAKSGAGVDRSVDGSGKIGNDGDTGERKSYRKDYQEREEANQFRQASSSPYTTTYTAPTHSNEGLDKGPGEKYTLIPTFEEVLEIIFSTYNTSSSYSTASEVYFNGNVYKANSPVFSTESPEEESEKWDQVDFSTCIYPWLENCHPQLINISVNVKGVQELLLENDLGKLKPGKPFQPFGNAPVVGSRFFIGSQEIFGKKLDSLEFLLDWEDPPSDFGDYYAGYNALVNPNFSNSVFKANLDFLEDGLWSNLVEDSQLFTTGTFPGAKERKTISLDFDDFEEVERDLNLAEPNQYKSNAFRGFMRVELTSPFIAFGHKDFSELMVEAYLTAPDADNDGTPEPDLPSIPYTPILKEFRINYSSSQQIDLTDSSKNAYKNRVEQFFHVHPFGHTEEHPYLWENTSGTLIPQFEEESYLYLGIDKLELPSGLSVLFQLAEGSADPELPRFDPEWSILSNNRWIDLEAAQIVFDSTDGLISSGVIQFDFSNKLTTGDSLFESQLHWLRAKVAQNTAAIHKAIDIQAQAVLVSFHDQNNNPEHLRTALPGGTITALKVNDSNVKKSQQPFSSFDGKLPEQSEEFLTRVSERLRHKSRSVNIWDYERMVLEEFPSIYKVKCCNHTMANIANGNDLEIAPGNVTVVTIPDLRNVNAVNPYEPKTPLHILDDVHEFLSDHISGWVELQVTNPLYESIEISCNVGFLAGKDPGYYITELDQDLKDFLSPWASNQDVDIVFGGKIHRSIIINFIEQRDYVDFVVDFKMYQTTDGDTDKTLVEEAEASTSRSILVSSLSHSISSVIEGEETCQGNVTGSGADAADSDLDCCGHNIITSS